MKIVGFTALGCVLIAGSVAAQPIRGSSQKAAYASPAEWKPLTSDCWVLGPGLGGMPGVPIHLHNTTVQYPIYAEFSSETFTVSFSTTIFNGLGKVTSVTAAPGVVTLDQPLPLPGSPTDDVTYTGSITFTLGPRNTTAHGWANTENRVQMRFENGSVLTNDFQVPFFSVQDPTRPINPPTPLLRSKCQFLDADNPTVSAWGWHMMEFREVLPILGPISREFPWAPQAIGYGYLGAGPLAEDGVLDIRLDPAFHDFNEGTLLSRTLGGAADIRYSLPGTIPDGPHRLLYGWERANAAGDKTLWAILGFNVLIGPGGVGPLVPQTPTPPPPPPSEPGTSPPPPTSESHTTEANPLTITSTAATVSVGQSYTITGTVDLTVGDIGRLHLDGTGNGFTCTATTCTATRTYTRSVAGTFTHTLEAYHVSTGLPYPFATLVVTVGTPTCGAFSITPTSQAVPASGGPVSVTVTGTSGCSRTATSNATWIAVTSGASGTGSGTVGLSVAANTAETTRTGTVTIAGQPFTVTQGAAPPSTCGVWTLTPTSQSVPVGGSIFFVTATGATGCARTAVSNAGWIAVQAGATGTGTGSVKLYVPINPGAERVGTVTIAGQVFTVTQAGAVTAPPGTIRSDLFERPDGPPGPNWAWQGGLGSPTIRGGSLGSTSPALVITWWTPDQFAPDQFSEATVAAGFNPATTRALQVFVRRQPQAHGTDVPWRYGFHYQPVTATTGKYTLKYDGGPGVVLAEIPGTQFVPGDVVRIEVQGSTIRGLLNGVVILTATHTALTGGQAGVVINALDGIALQAWDSWSGGSLP